MYALMWPAAPDDAAAPGARERLATLLNETRARTGDSRLTEEELRSGVGCRSRRTTIADRIFTVGAVLVLCLFVIGVIDEIRALLSLIL